MRSIGGVVAVLATCLCATSAVAEPSTGETVQAPWHHAVSTSPNPPAALAPLAGSPPSQLPALSRAPDLPPLTRAAARLRIDEMSPVRWLAHYGNVSIGQRE